MAIKETLIRAASKTKFFVGKNSPQILIGVGIACGVAAVVTACKATLKVAPEVKEAKAQMDDLDNSEGIEAFVEFQNNRRQEQGLEPIEMTDDEVKKEKRKLARHIVGVCAKYYAIPAGFMVAGTAAILCSYKIINGRLLRTAIAYESLQISYKKLKDYREKVVERYGSEVDQEIWKETGHTGHTETKTRINEETGEEETYDEFVPNEQKNMPWNSEYAIEYKNQSHAPHMDYEQLRTLQNWFNDRLSTRGYVFLNEVYEELGVRPKGKYVGLGWISREFFPNGYTGDGYIDFGVFGNDLTKLTQDTIAWRNDEADTVILDFNIDGPIYSMVDAINAEMKKEDDLWKADRAAFYRGRPQAYKV